MEDKLLQTAVTRVLQPVYEGIFYPCSYGFRPGKSQHQALEELTRQVGWKGMRYIIDADMQKWRNRVQESCSHGSVGEREGNEPLYPEPIYKEFTGNSTAYIYLKSRKLQSDLMLQVD